LREGTDERNYLLVADIGKEIRKSKADILLKLPGEFTRLTNADDGHNSVFAKDKGCFSLPVG
jgi:hypothetical protein